MSTIHTRLTFNEESGITSGTLNMIPTRRTMPPASWPSPVSRFLDSSNSPISHRGGRAIHLARPDRRRDDFSPAA
jgi:hypothetical protein